MDRRKSETTSFKNETAKSLDNEEEEEEEAEEEEEDAITLAQLSKSPKKHPKLKPSSSSSSSAKAKVLKEKEEKILAGNAKRRNSDVHIKFVVSGRAGNSSSGKPSMVTNDASCSSGQAKSSAVIRAQEVLSNLESEFPSFVKSLVRSHVASCFWMGLPGQFCRSHLPDKDVTVTLEDENGKQWGIKYLAYKTGLSAGWRQFAVAHKLLEGDVLVFQLVEPTKFKIYMIRANDLTEVDGALGLLNLDSYVRQSDTGYQNPDRDKTEMNAKACDNTNRKRPKSLPLSIVQKKKKQPCLPRSIPKPAEQSENDSEEVGSEVLEGSKFSELAIRFEDIRSFENFNIVVDGQLLDSEIPDDIRRAYYKLCCSQNAFLHDNVIKGMNKKLIIGTISETVAVANSIKACKITTSRDDFAAWDKSLKAFEILGLDVGFLRARLSQLAGMAYESEVFVDARKYSKSRTERARAETGMKKIETKLAELKEACDRFGAAIESLGSQAESYEEKFREKVNTVW